MSNIKNKGSEWNVWDLHIHTPASYRWDDGPRFQQMSNQEEIEKSCSKIIEQINGSEPIAFSIVDYFTFDGILKIREYLRNKPTDLKKTLFPGIELRLAAPTDFRLNVQVIFSEDITDQELKDFKSELKILCLDKERSLSNEAIIESARTLTPDKAKKYSNDYKTNNDKAYQLGCETIVITRGSFEKSIRTLGKDKCLVILPYDTYGGIEKLKWKKHPQEDIYYLGVADFFESRKPENIDLFLGKKTEKNKHFFDNFQQSIGGKSKPVLSGSDSHKIANYGCFPHQKKTWLKAEPTFKGLKQVMVEPAGRCFIGEKPNRLQVIKSKATKFISKITIKKKQDSSFDEIWFNNEVDFNLELVAIIGNKGSGKSALTDIIGLLGNSKQYDHFSFLNNKKFKEKSDYKSKHFQGILYWEDQSTVQKILNEPIKHELESVKYIPQSYLEKICNDINSKDNLFDKELKGVIFSHIPSEDRLGKSDLDSLLQFKTEEIESEISKLRTELTNITTKILSDRKKITTEYKEEITNKISEKQKELKAIKKIEPEKISQPLTNETDPIIQEKNKNLNELQSKKEKIAEQILSIEKDIEILSQKKASLNKIISQIKILKQDTEKRIDEINRSLNSIGYDDINVFDFQVSLDELEKKSEELQEILVQKKNQVTDIDTEGNLKFEEKNIQIQINKLTEEIDEPNKKYHKYLSEKKQWEQQVAEIQGDENKLDTISYLNAKLSEISNIPTKITILEKERNEIVRKIYTKITNLSQVYKEFYKPVQQFIKNNPFKEEDIFRISFSVSIVNEDFKNKFFELINRNKSGTFYGTENSEIQVRKLLDSYDFNNPEQVIQFVNRIFYLLENDCREKNIKKNRFELQARNLNAPEELYNMIFSLEYLKPQYFLKLNNKNLEQLSPGERGILLLIFYLMIDKDDRPLILDQPEENLDNQTIYKVLVPCIKKTKENRQVFLVTHNPNLAVVCDSEQIITASIDKKNNNAVFYHSGAIENPETNEKIMDILEGTQPAFENRELKYHKNKKR